MFWKKAVDNVNNKLTSNMLAIILLIIATAAGTCGFFYYKHYKQMESVVNIDTIYNNVYINNVNLGGFTKEQAVSVLEEQIQKPLEQKYMTLINKDQQYTFTYSQLGVKFDLEAAVNEAYNYGREGSIKERYEIVTYLDEVSKFLTADYTYDKNTIIENVKTLEDKIYVAPVNARATRENGEFVIIPEIKGVKLNVERTADAVCEMLDIKQDGDVIVATEEIDAEYKADSLKEMDSLIGSASTSYYGGGGRVTNMEVAASKINGTVLYPNEIFSTNAKFGAMTYDNGYRPAPVIVSGKLVDDFGGGVCQVSSTLYNAVLRAELEVVERQNHSLKVGYLDYGFDATLAGDYIDLKFKNSSDVPIYIEAYTSGGKVAVSIYGKETRPSTRKISFQSELVETINPPAEKITYDATLPEGTRRAISSAKKGYRYKVYKLIYENDSLVDKVQVNTSYYKPRAAEVTVGTKKAVEQKAPQPAAEKATEAA